VVGAVSLFFFPEGRRILERLLGVLFTLVVVGGVALTWRAQQLRNADRDLTPAQQATLGKAIGQFPASSSRCSRRAPTGRPIPWRWK